MLMVRARPVFAVVLFLATAATFQAGSAAIAGEAEDRAQLGVCVDKHITPDDSLIMRRLIFLFMSDVLQTDADIQGDVAAKRDAVAGSAAALITRMAESDCKAEVHALMADKPAGGAFKPLFEAIGKPVQTALTAGMPKGGAALGLAVMKKLDAATVADIQFGEAPFGTPSDTQPPRSPHLSRAAVAGVPLRLAFETALNPDCSPMGKTVIRVLKSPIHGTATIEDTKDFTSYETANQRYHCNEKRTAGTAIYYKSEARYTGPDFISYEVIYPSGLRRQIEIDLTAN
jgi:hypothetical protein